MKHQLTLKIKIVFFTIILLTSFGLAKSSWGATINVVDQDDGATSSCQNGIDGKELAPALEPANWTAGTGWTVSQGSATRVSSSGSSSISPAAPIVPEVGKKYQVTVVANVTAAANPYFQITFGGVRDGNNVLWCTYCGSWIYSFIIVPTDTSNLIITGTNTDAATITSISVQRLHDDVQTAINSASDGDTVSIPAGNCAWSNSVAWSNKKLTVTGAGKDVTNISITDVTAFSVTCSLTTPPRFTNMTFNQRTTGAVANTSGDAIHLYGHCGGDDGIAVGQKGYEVDHIHFHNVQGGNRGVFVLSIYNGAPGDAYGVVHDCISDGVGGFSLTQNYMNADFHSATLGSLNATFIEGNTIINEDSGMNGDTNDTANGGRIVTRFNTIVNTWSIVHGDYHDRGSTAMWEDYNNLRTTPEAGTGFGLVNHQGSGEALFYNNRINDPSGTSGFLFQHESACCPYGQSCGGANGFRSSDATWGEGKTASADAQVGRCDGTNMWDGNVLPDGYPCWWQGGTTWNDDNSFKKYSPVYVWNNAFTGNGNKTDLAVPNTCAGPPNDSSQFLVNRDYYNAVSKDAQTSKTSPFDGSTGMGFGLKQYIPDHCTTGAYPGQGTGYWATDENKLYYCSATDTWTVRYQPAACPHPQATGETGSCDFSVAGLAGYNVGSSDTTPPSAPSGLLVD